MKVLNLCCSREHRFEGWFGSEDDYQRQQATALIECPICADTAIHRLPSAPRLNVSKGRDEAPAAPPSPAPTTLQTVWMQALRHVLAHSDNVGERFAEEARRIHYGESEDRPIHGHATRQDAQALAEEGIEVVTLPLPEALKGPLQ